MLHGAGDLLVSFLAVCKSFLTCLSLLEASMAILKTIDDITISLSVRLQTLMACHIFMVSRPNNSLKRPCTMAVLHSKVTREQDHINLHSTEPINRPIAMPDRQRNLSKAWCQVSH